MKVDSDNAALRGWSDLGNHRTQLAELRTFMRQEVVMEVRKELRVKNSTGTSGQVACGEGSAAGQAPGDGHRPTDGMRWR